VILLGEQGWRLISVILLAEQGGEALISVILLVECGGEPPACGHSTLGQRRCPQHMSAHDKHNKYILLPSEFLDKKMKT
jgi:hypothetical protein